MQKAREGAAGGLVALEETVAELERQADYYDRIGDALEKNAPRSPHSRYVHAAALREAASLLRTHLDRLRGDCDGE